MITPDVGGGFGAKIGADPEFALVAWLAQQVGRPVRWSETRSENMTGMVQGRGPAPDGRRSAATATARSRAYRLDVLQDAGAYPRLGAVLPMFTRMMAPGVYDIRTGGVAGPRARHEHDVDRRPTAAPDAPRPPRPSSGPWTCSPPRSAWTRPRCAAATCCRPTSSRSPPRAARPTTPASTRRRSTPVLDAVGYADLRAEQAARRERGDAVQLGIGVSVFVEITGGGRVQGGRRGRGAPRRHGHRAHRHLAARPGARHGVGDARERAPGHPDREDHREARRHRPRPARRGHHGLAQPADRRRGRLPGGGRAGGAGQAAGGRRAGGERRRPRGRRSGAVVVTRHRHSGVRWRDLAAREPLRVETPVRLGGADASRSARTSPSSTSTSESGKAVIDKIVTVDDAGPCSTRCSPRASGTAASRRASRRRCWRRSSTTRTATRSPPRSPTTASRPRRSCPASRCSTWPRRRTSTRWGSRGSARRAPSAPPRRCRAR